MRTLPRRHFIAACLSLAAWCTPAMAAPRPPLVLAPASLQESLTDAANAWAAAGHPRPVLSFAASSALARQVVSGAPADLFLSADEKWMDYVATKGLLAPGSRVSFLGNRIALIAPVTSQVHLAIAPGFALSRALGATGRLAMADPDAVPAGKYAEAALQNLGVWTSVASRVARADNVRAALMLVERGEVPLGIVYTTDARVSSRVRIVGVFPENSHPPITYPVARLAKSVNPEAEAFRRFLVSRAGKAIFVRYGFSAR